MKGWLLDTNVIAEIGSSRPDPKVVRWVEALPEPTLYLSILTLAEYRKGIEHLEPSSPLRPRLNRSLVALERRFSGRILPISNEVALRWGAISGEVKRLTGHPPPVIDTMLAATAREHDLILATRNVADVQHCGAIVFNPWKDDFPF
ncbi:type II toxin-antitoxin system VapC family toxin [Telmatobacter bradus]|uniref:type II toxin-antitoxin system VapC family toxin n=1 Tax=Telmatobacter bradus TaxID=474953 RepID=UPI003B429896